MNNKKKPITIPRWLIVVVVLFIIILLAGGGYGFTEHRKLKKDYKDSLKVRNERVEELEQVILNANDFEETETVVTDRFKSRFYKERKLRKDAEAELFTYRNNSRFHNDSFLSRYTYRRRLQEID